MYGKNGYQLGGTVAPQAEMDDGLETVLMVRVTGEKAGFVPCEE